MTPSISGAADDAEKWLQNFFPASTASGPGSPVNDTWERSRTHPNVEFFDTAQTTLYYRYGFKPIAGTSPPPAIELTADTVSQLLGKPRRGKSTTLDSEFGNNVSVFLGYMMKAKELRDMPADFYEPRQQGPAALQPSPIQLRWEIIKGSTYYFIALKAPQPDVLPECIVVRSAASAVEILRRRWTTTEEITVNLVARGIPFNTFIRGLPPASPRNDVPLNPYRGLGFRPKAFQTTHAAYTGYEGIRNRIFSSDRGRVALLMGGVVARLAKDVVSVHSVCSGPSKTVLIDGHCTWDGRPSSPAYWDDAFTAEELDIICGVYEVSTGQSDSHRDGEQTRCVSWWPTPAAWKNSGLNLGYWTPLCEEWFQDRLAQIRTGNAQLYNLVQWRQKLAHNPACVPLSRSNDQIAEAFLIENGTRVAQNVHDARFPKAVYGKDAGRQSSNGFCFTLRTQDPFPPTETADGETAEMTAFSPELTSQMKEPVTPEIQELTRQYWDTRRKLSSLVSRGKTIENRLRALNVKIPEDIYLSSSDLTRRLADVETNLTKERSLSREAENILKDIQRECATPTVVPMLLDAFMKK
ncbi:hypothetical protein B0H11DRAFT_1811808 [Mycena galericulata]|nr:hypothetical protein B0H11DRAFT_1811808 [Mycena galericulata]